MGSKAKRRSYINNPKVTAADLVGEAFDQALGNDQTLGNPEMAKIRRRIETGSTKKKCCRSKPRCKKCPTVLHRLRKQGALRLDDAALKAALIKARKW